MRWPFVALCLGLPDLIGGLWGCAVYVVFRVQGPGIVVIYLRLMGALVSFKTGSGLVLMI